MHQIELEMQYEQLREAHAALEISRDRFVDFYEQAPVGYLTLVGHGQIEEINGTGAVLLGLARAKLLQLRFIDFVAQESKSHWQSYWASALNCDNKTICELTLQCGDGLLRYVRLDSLRLTKAGQASTLRIVLSDITERKQRDDQLRLQALVLDQIQDHVTITDLNGVVTYVNQSMARKHLCDRAGKEMLGQHFSGYGDAPEADATQQEIGHETLVKGAWRGKVVNFMVDGSKIIVDLRTSLVNDLNGKPLAMVGVGTDITERLNIEETLRRREQYQRAVLDNFPFMVWLKDETGRFLDVNATFASTFGWPSAQSLIGKSDLDITTPDLAALYHADD